MAVAVVTGATSGIGRHLALVLAETGYKVVATGRRQHLLDSLAASSANIIPVCADVTTESGIAAVQAAVSVSGQNVKYLVQNAGILGDIAPLASYDQKSWLHVMQTNVNGPLFLLQALLPHMSLGSRVLHVSSGAANSAIAGWGAYCTSKAAFSMLWRALAIELQPAGIQVGSVRPGVVDTGMQAAIRQGDEQAFPDKAKFLGMYEKRLELNNSGAGVEVQAATAAAAAVPPAGALDTPHNVALFLRWLLTETGEDEFSAQEWDIRDKAHHGRWIH